MASDICVTVMVGDGNAWETNDHFIVLTPWNFGLSLSMYGSSPEGNIELPVVSSCCHASVAIISPDPREHAGLTGNKYVCHSCLTPIDGLSKNYVSGFLGNRHEIEFNSQSFQDIFDPYVDTFRLNFIAENFAALLSRMYAELHRANIRSISKRRVKMEEIALKNSGKSLLL